jgi:hypothetical protein
MLCSVTSYVDKTNQQPDDRPDSSYASFGHRNTATNTNVEQALSAHSPLFCENSKFPLVEACLFLLSRYMQELCQELCGSNLS